MSVADSRFYGNAGFGISNSTPEKVVEATGNWWGHPSGPNHPTANPEGLGDKVSDNVVFDPWMTSLTPRQPSEMRLDEPVSGSVLFGDFADHYLTLATDQPLLIEVAPLTGTQLLWVYERHNALSTWTAYDLRTQMPNSRGVYEVLLPAARAGVHYLSIMGRNVDPGGGGYEARVTTVGRYLSDVDPRSAGNTGPATLTVTGMPFEPGLLASLMMGGAVVREANSVSVLHDTQLEVTFDLTGLTPATYDLAVTWPDSSQAVLAGALTVNPGLGPKLVTSATYPTSVRTGRDYTFTLDVGNEGDANLPAPLLQIVAANALIRFADQPEYGGDRLQFYAFDPRRSDGVLPPGDHVQWVFTYRPTSFARVEFTVSEAESAAGGAAQMSNEVDVSQFVTEAQHVSAFAQAVPVQPTPFLRKPFAGQYVSPANHGAVNSFFDH